MTEKLNDFTLYEIDGETYNLNEIRGFIESCKEYHKIVKQQEETIQEKNKTISNITRTKLGLKLNNQELTKERNALVDELNHIKSMSMFEFGNTYTSSESLEADGRAFARALLGGK